MRNFLESKYFRHTLGIAGMINVMAGIIFALQPQYFLILFYKNLPAEIVQHAAVQSIVTLMFIFILIIGFGYLWSMRDPVRNKLYLLIGGMGKLAAVILWTVSFFQGIGTPLLLVASFNDVGLGILFIVFFLYNRKN